MFPALSPRTVQSHWKPLILARAEAILADLVDNAARASAPGAAAASASGDTEVVGGVACPVDPMEALQCESCQ